MTHRHPLHTSLAAALLAGASLSWAQAPAAPPVLPQAPPSVGSPRPQVAPTPDAGNTAGSVVTTSSGLIFKLMKQGTGPSPLATDTVKVHYRGTFMDGKEFDSSFKNGAPAEFPLNRVIKCWTEGVQRLQVGGSARLTCPPAIAYGANGAGGVIPPNATLQFEVELLGISK